MNPLIYLFPGLCAFMLGAGAYFRGLQQGHWWGYIYTVKNTSRRGKFAQVYLNGQPVKEAIYANTLTGCVEMHDIPHRIIGTGNNTRIATIIEYGRVQVTFIDENSWR